MRLEEIRMRDISNLCSALAVGILLLGLMLKALGFNVDMTDLIKVASFIKVAFVQVDVSVWIRNLLQK